MAKATLPTPVYAYVGVTDLAVEVVRDFVAETQTRIAGVQKTATDPKALRNQAKAYRKAIESRVAELQSDAMNMVDDNVAVASDAYSDLVKRGESLVGRIRRQESTKATVTTARTTVAKAKTTNTQAKKTTDKATTTARTAAKRATTAAKRTNTKPATKKAAATKSSAKATITTATKTAGSAAKAVSDATQKVGD